MHEHLPGVSVPTEMIAGLEDAGDGRRGPWVCSSRSTWCSASRAIAGVGGVHLMGMGHDDVVRAVVEGTGLFPRPTGVR